MKSSWKQAVGAAALSAMALGLIGGSQAMAQAKPAARGKSATIPPPSPEAAPTSKRGHLCDPHPSCTKIVSDRAVSPPTVDCGAAPPSAEYGVDGQIIDRGRHPRSNQRIAQTAPTSPPPAPASACKDKPPANADTATDTSATQIPVRPGKGTCASYVRNKKNELVCSNSPPVDQPK